MANNLIQIKRTSVSGRAANTLTLPNPGELALNMTDGILYSTNGQNVFEIGANNTNVRVSNTITIRHVSANGSNGIAGQVLTSNGSIAYWADATSLSSVNVNAQYIWTNTHTFTNVITFSNSITIGNSTVNTEIIPGYLSVGNTTVNTQIEPGIVRLSGSEIFIGNDVVVNSSSIFVGNVDIAFNSINLGNVSVSTNNIVIEGRYVLTSDTAGVANDAYHLGGVAAANYQTTAGLSANVATLTANNTNFVGEISAANVVSNAQLAANLGNYQTTAGLSDNVATLTSNNTSFVGSVSAANVVSNAQLAANLGNYQTTSGLADNVATLTANNTNFVGTISAANVVSNAQLSGNLANYQTTAGLAGNVATLAANSATYLNGNTASDLNTYADNKAANAYSNAISYVDGKAYVNSSQLSSNLSNYQTTAGLAGNVALLTANNSSYAFGKTEDALNVNSAYNANNSAYLGGVAAASYQTTAGLAANVATLTSNNTTYAYGKTESSLDVNSALTSNNASYLGGNTASDLRTYTDNKAANAYSNAVSYVDGKSYVNTAQLSGNLSNYAQLAGATFTGNVSANNANTLYDFTVGRNLTVSGNLTVTGNVTTIGANNLSIVDNFIYLNSNNDTNNIDIGFAGNYNDGVYRHTGFFRDASDGYWKVFDGYEPEPDANVNIDTSNNTFKIANFWANNARLGNTTVYSTINSTSYSGSANNTTYFGGNAITNFVRITGAYTLSGNITFNSNVILGSGLRANGSYGNAGQVLVSNGSGGVYWSEDQLYGNVVANAITVNILTVNFISLNTGTITVGNATVNTDIGNNYISVGNESSYSNIYSGFISIGNSVGNTVINSSSIAVKSIYANGSLGTTGQILASNGTGIYWSDNQNVNAITANSLSANYVNVTRGTLTVGNSTVNTDIGNNYVSVGNSSGFVNVYSNRILIGGASINSTVYTGTASPNLNASFSWTNNHSFSDVVNLNGNVFFTSRVSANGSYGSAGQFLTASGTGVYWSSYSINLNASYSWTNNHTFGDVVTLNGNTFINSRLSANGSYGSAGQFLTTSGTGVYWSDTLPVNVNATYSWTNNHTFNDYVTFNSRIAANSSYGVAGQFLTSKGTGGGVYWSDYPAVNVNASYSWTNNHTFSDIVSFNGNTTLNANITIGVGARLRANGSFGTAGQVLASNGTGVYWTADQGANSLTANSLTANYVSITSGTLSVGNSTVNTDIGNNYISVGNTTGFTNIYSNYITIGNSVSNSTINSTAFTGTANNATYFGGNAIGNFVRTTGAHTLSGNITFSSNVDFTGVNGKVTFGLPIGSMMYPDTSGNYDLGASGSNWKNFYISGGIYAGAQPGAPTSGSFGTNGQVLTSNGSAVYWSSTQSANAITANTLSANYVSITSGTLTVGNSTVNTDIGNNYISVGNTVSFVNVYSDRIYIGNSAANATINSTIYTGTANNATLFGGNAIGNFVRTSGAHTLSGNITFNGNVTIGAAAGINANGSYGTSGQLLASNGTSVYWISPAAANVNTAAQYTWTNTHTFTNVVSFSQTINATANNSTNLGGVPAASYVNTSGNYTVAGNINFTAANVAFTGNVRINGGLIANGSLGTAGQVLASNGSAVYWTADQGANAITANTLTANYVSITSGTLTVGNSTVNTDIGNNYVSVGNTISFVNVYSDRIYIGNSAANATINSTIYTGTANNTNFVGTVSAANVVSNAQLAANLANYQTTAGLSANVAKLTTNNTTYFGGNAITEFVRVTGAYTVSGNLTFNGNVTIGTTAGINANGGYGTSGQVLTSNGSSVYWSTVSGGGGGFTNGSSISVNNFVITGPFTANGSNGTSGQFLVSNGTGVYWASMSNGTVSGTSQTFTGNGTANAFTLAASIASAPDVVVSLNGLIQTPTTHYTISGTTLTFTSNPSNNGLIEVRSFTSNGGGAGGGGAATLVKSLDYTGNLYIGNGTDKWWFSRSWTLNRLVGFLDTAPTGNSVIVRINKNGSNAGLHTISAGNTTFASNLAISVVQGDYLTVDITQVGSTVPGSDLSLIFEYS